MLAISHGEFSLPRHRFPAEQCLSDDFLGRDRHAALLKRLFGDPIANELRAPFILGDIEALYSLLVQAGIMGADIATHVGTARFSWIDSWIQKDVKGGTLADLIDKAQYSLLLREAKTALQSFTLPDGTVAFDAAAHIATARKAY